MGDIVDQYFEEGGLKGDRVGWKNIGIGSKELYSKLEVILRSRTIPVSEEEDTLFWCVAKSRDYSAKIGCEIQIHRLRDTVWPQKLCWNSIILPKARAFLWISLHDTVLTRSRLKTIGILGPIRCVMCKGNEETINHLLYSCPYVSRCWDWLFDMVNSYTVGNEDLKDFLLSWPQMVKFKWGDIWLVGSAMVAWHIWKERNKRIFKEASLSIKQLILKIKAAIEEVISGKSSKRKTCRYNNRDRNMETKWSFKDKEPSLSPKRQVDRSQIKWTAPPTDWVKLNFDGASKGNFGRVGFMAILGEENGSLICKVYSNSGVVSNNEAEIRLWKQV
ncbi:hypothetical protein SUGI_0581130 [Cryptomeria japonica]|nr:hypothetical protein SUGI_0581130 [Cryptomeria japonica]